MLSLEQAHGRYHGQLEIIGRTKYFDFQRAAVFCLGQYLTKHKTTKILEFEKNVPLATPMPAGDLASPRAPRW